VPRALALACVAAALLPLEARAGDITSVVVIAPGRTIDRVRAAEDAAVGLVVPDAGPTTSEARARAALECGEVVNSLRGEPGSGNCPGSLASGIPRGVRVEVGIPRGGLQPNDRRYAILVEGWRGLLTSDSTRIPGIVSIADLATGRLRAVPADDPLAEARALDERIDENNAYRLPAFLLWAALTAGLALVRPRAAALGFATVLLANLLLGVGRVSGIWAVLALTAGATAAALGLARVTRTPVQVGALFAGTIVAYLAAFALDQSWLSLSPLGPTQNSRFYGLSNLLETILLVPALAGASLLGRTGFVAVAGLTLVTVAGSRFGADGGGAIVLAAAFAVLGVGLAGAGRRALTVALALAIALVLALVALDALTGASSHVTRSLSGGPTGLASDLADRVALSFERATAHWYTAAIVVGAAVALALLVARTLPRATDRVHRALLMAFATAIAVSLVVNDSPVDVTVAGLVGYLALARAAAISRASSPTCSDRRSA
jgi:hypothetical protein